MPSFLSNRTFIFGLTMFFIMSMNAMSIVERNTSPLVATTIVFVFICNLGMMCWVVVKFPLVHKIKKGEVYLTNQGAFSVINVRFNSVEIRDLDHNIEFIDSLESFYQRYYKQNISEEEYLMGQVR